MTSYESLEAHTRKRGYAPAPGSQRRSNSLRARFVALAGATAVLTFGVLIPTGALAASGQPQVAVSGATYHAITPTRLLDTRVGNGLTG
ncbi:MAG TPA: hypothetical protein VF344_01485, partial [Candidatus Limnocylindrales bacterium]